MSSSDFRTQLGAQMNLFSLANGRVRPIQDYPPVGLLDPISGTRKEIPFAEFCSQLTALEEGVISPLFFAAKTNRVTKGAQKVIRGPFGTFYRPRQQEVYGTILDFIPNFDHLASDAIERDPQWAISVRAMSASSTPSLPSRTHTAAISDAGASPLGFIDETIDEQLLRDLILPSPSIRCDDTLDNRLLSNLLFECDEILQPVLPKRRSRT